jgi:hypothetical protein
MLSGPEDENLPKFCGGICSPRVMTAVFEHVIGSTVRDACGPAQEILDTITIESILNAG